ncbi:MAG: KGG domain-containing protein [Pseudomonadota bacterium]
MISDNQGQKTSSKRGFASMDPQRQKEIASLGGKAAHASGKAHEFNTAEAREAGRKGGRAGRRSTNGASAQS